MSRRRPPLFIGHRGPSPIWLVLLTAVIASAAVLGLFARGQVFGGHDHKAAGPLRLDKVVVRNGRFGSDSVGLNGEQTKGSSPTIDLTLSNEGQLPVVLTAAHITVVALADFHVCYSQGGGPIPASPPYWTELPFEPRPAERHLATDLFEKVDPQDPYRLLLRFRPSPNAGSDDELYALDVTVDTTSHELNAGRFLMSLPAALDRSGATFPEDEAFLDGAYKYGNPTALTWCYRRNLEELHRLLTLGGQAAPELQALRYLALAPRWPAVTAREPASRAARLLVRTNDDVNVDSAVFAAQQSGDSNLATRTRRAASSHFLRQARKDAAAKLYGLAEPAVRRSLALEDTVEGRGILIDAERALAERRPHRRPGK